MTDMPLRGMSSHTAARCCRVICGWGSAASSTHGSENPAYNNFAQGVDMPRQTAKPAAACSSIAENVPRRLPSGWHSARHACLAPVSTAVTPTAYRAVLPVSRTAWCSACAPGRSQPCYSSQSPFVGRSVGGPRHAPTAGKRPVPTRSGTRVAVFPSVRGGARRDHDARERPPTALSAWFPRVTPDPTDQGVATTKPGVSHPPEGGTRRASF
jgi:hypothetical protein